MAAWQKPGLSNEHYTPKYIFTAMKCTFDLDVASPPRQTHVPCKARLTSKSLEADWNGFIWMNPPFGGRNAILPWLVKFFDHANGIGLCPDRTSAPWFQETLCMADLLLFVSPKIQFERPDGTPGRSPGDGTVLFASGPRGAAALCRAHKLGMLAAPVSNGTAPGGKR